MLTTKIYFMQPKLELLNNCKLKINLEIVKIWSTLSLSVKTAKMMLPKENTENTESDFIIL